MSFEAFYFTLVYEFFVLPLKIFLRNEKEIESGYIVFDDISSSRPNKAPTIN